MSPLKMPADMPNDLREKDPARFAQMMKRDMEMIREAEMAKVYPPYIMDDSILGGIRQSVPRPPRQPSDGEMLCMRMRWGNILAGGFAHVDIHACRDKVFVWIVTKDDQSVVLEDEAALYPSDGLITKIRLIQQE